MSVSTRAIIKSTDMTPEMQQKVVDLAVIAMVSFRTNSGQILCAAF